MRNMESGSGDLSREPMEIMPDVDVIGASTLCPREGAAARESRTSKGSITAHATLRTQLGVITWAWVFGSVWSTTTTGSALTVFAKGLGASNFQFGLLTALPFIASLMSVPGSVLIECTGERKRLFLWGFTIQRGLWVLIAVAPVWLVMHYGMAATGAALGLFLMLMLLMYSAGATGGPAWVSWMADTVPSRLNGKYFSRRRQWGILSAVPAAVVVGKLLDDWAAVGDLKLLRSCAALFVLCAIFGLADIHLFQFVPAARGKPRTGAQLLGSLREPFGNRAFLRYSGFVGALTFAVNFLGQFTTLFLLEQAGSSNMGAQMILVVAPMLAQLLVLGLWGRAADRMGKRPLLVLASIGLVPVGAGWCFVTPHAIWLAYLLSALGAAFWTGVEVANLNLVLETSAGGDSRGGSSYAAANSVIINIAGCMGGLAAGVIAQALRDWHWHPSPAFKDFNFYDVLFAIGGVLRLLAVIAFVPLLHEPAARPARETLRFLTGGLAALLITTSSQPLRMLELFRRSRPRIAASGRCATGPSPAQTELIALRDAA